MSDAWEQIPDEGAVEGAEANAGPDEATGAEATPQEPEVEYLEIDDSLAGKHVKITVDGEETSVPLSELTQGYSRQADYTRKTQELANQRKEAEAALQLQRAFEANPRLTVQILADRQGMSVEQFLGLSPQQQNAVAQQTVQESDEYTDPLEQQLAESNKRLQTLEQQIAQERADREVREVINGLKQQYQASDDDIRATVQQALQLGLPPQMLPMLYQATAFQKLQTQQQTRQEVTQQQTAQEQARRQAAAAAGQVMATGTGATGTTPDPASDGRMSLSDAIAAGLAGFPD